MTVPYIVVLEKIEYGLKKKTTHKNRIIIEFLTFYLLQDENTCFDTCNLILIGVSAEKFAVKDENAISHVFGQVPVAAFNPRLMIAYDDMEVS